MSQHSDVHRVFTHYLSASFQGIIILAGLVTMVFVLSQGELSTEAVMIAVRVYWSPSTNSRSILVSWPS